MINSLAPPIEKAPERGAAARRRRSAAGSRPEEFGCDLICPRAAQAQAADTAASRRCSDRHQSSVQIVHGSGR